MNKFKQQYNMTKEELDELIDKDGGYYFTLYHEQYRDYTECWEFEKRKTRDSLLYSTVTHPRESRELHIINGHVIVAYSPSRHNYYPFIEEKLEEFLQKEQLKEEKK